MEGQETANGNTPLKGKNEVINESRGVALWNDWPGPLDRAGMPFSP